MALGLSVSITLSSNPSSPKSVAGSVPFSEGDADGKIEGYTDSVGFIDAVGDELGWRLVVGAAEGISLVNGAADGCFDSVGTIVGFSDDMVGGEEGEELGFVLGVLLG